MSQWVHTRPCDSLQLRTEVQRVIVSLFFPPRLPTRLSPHWASTQCLRVLGSGSCHGLVSSPWPQLSWAQRPPPGLYTSRNHPQRSLCLWAGCGGEERGHEEIQCSSFVQNLPTVPASCWVALWGKTSERSTPPPCRHSPVLPQDARGRACLLVPLQRNHLSSCYFLTKLLWASLFLRTNNRKRQHFFLLVVIMPGWAPPSRGHEQSWSVCAI